MDSWEAWDDPRGRSYVRSRTGAGWPQSEGPRGSEPNFGRDLHARAHSSESRAPVANETRQKSDLVGDAGATGRAVVQRNKRCPGEQQGAHRPYFSRA